MGSGGDLPVHELLRTCSTRLCLPKDQTIHVPGTKDTNLYYIEEGTVRFSLNSYDGDEKILYILGPGNFLTRGVSAALRKLCVIFTVRSPVLF
ncbi:MAG: cyclic nucleotide-binding domain-containing protein [Hungatella sp.]|uniref:cyclic nucleotide-binding domain-containing protein n=1 Tax=Hungatella sp. TaxID=2613924 RepID=UPI0039946E97